MHMVVAQLCEIFYYSHVRALQNGRCSCLVWDSWRAMCGGTHIHICIDQYLSVITFCRDVLQVGYSPLSLLLYTLDTM